MLHAAACCIGLRPTELFNAKIEIVSETKFSTSNLVVKGSQENAEEKKQEAHIRPAILKPASEILDRIMFARQKTTHQKFRTELLDCPEMSYY